MMKASLNVFLIIAIIAAIVIPLGTCKPATSGYPHTDYTNITEHETKEASSGIGTNTSYPLHRHFINLPSRTLKLDCPSGQKRNSRGVCRKLL
ncbi:PREDICTED: uncharacterized protein LOC105564422 [Vollenhovia emeryi]|uniref:uncharacterized protein LOC105564422 n=1 Tax=Vollenhovia emeryi TaxID=411798 RepID=UPI0005F58B7C|nr:PREDICTED: uncharacterized protein LOC105564422 [Vollenhovia emeryi]